MAHLTLDQLLTLKAQRPHPMVVMHCGSTTRAREAFREWQLKDTLAGKIVLTIGAHKNDADLGITPEQAIELDILHLQKIDRADEVFILNVGHYLGASTLRELLYAKRLGKPIRWLEHPTIYDHVFVDLYETREQLREPGKSGLVIPLDEYAKSLDMTAVALRRCLVKLDEQKRIVARKMNYPDSIPESWSISFPGSEEEVLHEA